LWDVAGTGIEPIADQEIATRLRAKVNAFNAQSAVVVGMLTLAFVILPEGLRLLLS